MMLQVRWYMILEKEFDYYLAHKAELLKRYAGKFLVIKDRGVIGVYHSDIEALQETSKTHNLGTFLIQKCEPGAESHTQTFHSRFVIG